MALKNIELARAENLPKDIRKKYGLNDTGLVIIETLNPELRTEYSDMPENGMRGYFESLGDFTEIEVTE